jgi:DNA-binding response OmpR family regulator
MDIETGEADMAERILLVEDDPTLRTTLTYRLQHEGYTVEAVADGDRAIDSACNHPPHLILLDLMLPGTDGLTVCRKLRACCVPSQRMPIIMVTARGEESDIVMGLEAGADDYVTKPFSWLALRARIRAHLRRTQADGQTEEDKLGSLDVAGVHIDLDTRLVHRAGIPVEMTNRLYFVRHRGMVLTRSRLLERVWGSTTREIPTRSMCMCIGCARNWQWTLPLPISSRRCAASATVS